MTKISSRSSLLKLSLFTVVQGFFNSYISHSIIVNQNSKRHHAAASYLQGQIETENLSTGVPNLLLYDFKTL